ncbi:MAG: hydroxymethylglutaryl-CoA lyase, partial [Acidimicrobiia bacterium]|nr:hydroxymethylglutaryl-CoA lyase [Acidimicrobiia bacterium]
LLDDVGYDTGIDLGHLLSASAFVSSLVGHPVASRLAEAGSRN